MHGSDSPPGWARIGAAALALLLAALTAPAPAAEIEALRAEVERLRHQLTASKPAKGSPVGR